MTTNTTTPSRKEMIDAIYEKIADKTLSFGCIIQSKYGESIYLDTRPGQLYNIYRPNYKILDREEGKIKIIGHPVMIGDILEWIENNILNDEDIEYQYQYIFRYWLGKHLPITEQSDECVKFVYNLISE